MTGIARTLSKLGVCSRSEAERSIRAGRVRVNGRIVRNPETPFPVAGRIEIDGKSVKPPRRCYLMLNKPRGLVTSAQDEHGRDTVYRCLDGLDLPWVPDGLQRDGPQVREPVDALLRTGLARAGVSWQVIYGQHERRLENAMKAITSIANTDQLTLGNGQKDHEMPLWSGLCAACGDPACEHRLFTALMRQDAAHPAPDQDQ